jgi:hypothetical protein
MLQHMTRSRGWNITEQINGNVVNEIELGTEILAIKSQILQVSQSKGNRTTGIIMDVQIRLIIIYRREVSVMSEIFLNHRVTHLRVQ